MNYYNQFTTFQSHLPVVVHSYSSPTVEEMDESRIMRLAEKHERLACLRGKGAVMLYLLGAGIISFGENIAYRAWKDEYLSVVALGIVAVLIGSCFTIFATGKYLTKRMHSKASEEILLASSYKEASKIDDEAVDWRWWSLK